MIDPNRKYRTRGRRAVRIYATDGIGNKPVHGAIEYPDGWLSDTWYRNGYHIAPGHDARHDLVEVTLADELRDQIPWEALRPEIRWVALNVCGDWKGSRNKPHLCDDGKTWYAAGGWSDLDAIAMPEVDPARWRETLVERPEDK